MKKKIVERPNITHSQRSPAMHQHHETTIAELPSFAEKYQQTHSGEVVLILPKGNPLNQRIVDSFAPKAHNGVKTIEGAVFGLSTDDVYMLVMDLDSEFHKMYQGRVVFEDALDRLEADLRQMEETRDGRFTRQLVVDKQILAAIDKTLKQSDEYIAEMANLINFNDVLIVDDENGGAQGISGRVKFLLRILSASYAPKSTTVLKLLSFRPKGKEQAQP